MLRFLILLFATGLVFAQPGQAADAPVARTATLIIDWDHDDPTPATEFRVYQQTGDTWAMVKSVTGAPAPKTATLTAVPAGVHTYRVTALGPWGESQPSDPVSTAAPAGPPTKPRVQVVVQVTVSVP